MAEEPEEPEQIAIVSVDIEPNNCELQAPLKLALQFACEAPLDDVYWRLRYTVDTAKKKKVVYKYDLQKEEVLLTQIADPESRANLAKGERTVSFLNVSLERV